MDFDEAWNILRSSLHEIHSKNASQLSFEELYRHAYKLVLKKKGEMLYQKVKSFEEDWLAQTVQPQILASISPTVLCLETEAATIAATVNEKRADGEKLLRALKGAWEDHNLCMNMITDVLMYMVRTAANDRGQRRLAKTGLGARILQRFSQTLDIYCLNGSIPRLRLEIPHTIQP